MSFRMMMMKNIKVIHVQGVFQDDDDDDEEQQQQPPTMDSEN